MWNEGKEKESKWKKRGGGGRFHFIVQPPILLANQPNIFKAGCNRKAKRKKKKLFSTKNYYRTISHSHPVMSISTFINVFCFIIFTLPGKRISLKIFSLFFVGCLFSFIHSFHSFYTSPFMQVCAKTFPQTVFSFLTLLF